MHVATRDDETIAPRYSSPKHLDQKKDRVGSTASFLLTFALTVSMLLSLVPSLAWAEVVENYAEVGEIIAERLGYTVDVTYDDYTYSFPGEGSYKVSEVLSVLGINATIDDVNLELVSGTDKAGALYLTRPNGEEWYLNSDVAFDSTYELTVVSGDVAYVITVTDVEVPQETDLMLFLSNFEIVGLTKGDNGSYNVTEGEPYQLMLYFEESAAQQFKVEDTLRLELPEGIVASNPVTDKEMIVSVSHDGTSSDVRATYSIDEYGILSVKFDQEDANYDVLTSAPNVKFHLAYDAVFDKSQADDGTIKLIDRDITVSEPTEGSAWVRKSGELDRTTGRMKYTVLVGASNGQVDSATVSDTISGNALAFLPGTLTASSSNGSPRTYTGTPGDSGFELVFSNLEKDEVITITYEAEVNYNLDDEKNGKLTAEQTGNTVTVTTDENQSNTATFSQEITYATTGKSAGNVTDNTDGTKTIEWVITYNADALTSAAGHVITDSISAESSKYMSYDDSGLTVYVKTKDGEPVATFSVGKNEIIDSSDATKWSYTLPNESSGDYDPSKAYVYEIHYNTVVNMDEVNKTGNTVVVDNTANGVTATYGVQPSTKIEVTKSVTNISDDRKTVTWEVTFTVPKGGLSSAVVTDTLPGTWIPGNSVYQFDELSGTIADANVEGLLDGETFAVSPGSLYKKDGAIQVITFYQDTNKTIPGLKASESDRTIKLTYTTTTNETWLEYGDANGLGTVNHTNNVNVNGVETSATAVLGKSGIKKSGEVDSWNSDGVAERIRYDITLSGVSTDTVTITDEFPTEYLQLSTNIYKYVAIYGGNEWWQGSGEIKIDGTNGNTVTETGSGISITTAVPKQADGSYYPYYRISYFLEVRPGVDLMKLAIENSGKFTLTNTASWNDASASFDYDTVYDYLDKVQVGETASVSTSADGSTTTSSVNSTTVGNVDGHLNRMATYQITLNPQQAKLKDGYGGDPLVLTDTMSTNLGIDPTTVKIETVPADRVNQVTYKTDFDQQGRTVATYYIPDETSVTITYSARVFGNGTVSFSNTASINGRTETVNSSANMDNSGGGDASVVELQVLKSDGNHQGDTLKDVWFRFYPQGGQSFINGHDVTELYYKTDENGQFVISGSHAPGPDMDGNQQNYGEKPIIYPNVVYYLEEVNTPDGFEQMDHPYEFVFVEDSALVDHAGTSGQYRYYMTDAANIENWRYTGLVVQKKVESANPEDLAKSYTFTLTLLNVNGEVDTTRNDDVFHISSSTQSYQEAKFTNGEMTFSLKDGEQWRIYGLAAGQRYKITETGLDGSMSVSYGVTEADGTPITSGNTSGSTYTGTLPDGDGVAVVTATNTQQGAFRLTKAVTVNDADPNGGTLADGTYTFTITGPGIDDASGKTATIEIKNGAIESATLGGTSVDDAKTKGYLLVGGLKPGTYTIEETGSTNTYAQNVDSNPATVEVVAGVTGEASPLVTITNNVDTGSLVVRKVLNSDRQDDLNQQFTFTVTLTNADGSAYQLGGSDGAMYGNMKFINGVATFTLKRGEEIKAENLPVGVHYTVTETAVSGFTQEGVVGDSGVIGENESVAEFTNKRDTGGFTVKKEVVNAASFDPKEFSFTVTLSDTSITGTYGDMIFEDGVATFALEDGNTKTATGLPVGITYTVEETPVAGYDTTWTRGSTGTIAALTEGAEPVVITATNTRQTGNLTVTKNTVGLVSNDQTHTFHFVVTLSESSISGTYGTGDTGMTFTNGKAEFDLAGGKSKTATGLPAGVTYTVVETVEQDQHYVTSYSGSTGTIAPNRTSEATVTNVRNAGGLSVTKSVLSAAESDKSKRFTFTIELSNANGDTDLKSWQGYVEYVDGSNITQHVEFQWDDSAKKQHATFTLASGQTALVVKKEGEGDNATYKSEQVIPDGTHYVVTETTVDGFTVVKSGQEGGIEANKTSAASFTNQATGSLRLIKQVTVNGSATTGTLADGTYTFNVVGLAPSTTSRTVTITIENGAYKSGTIDGTAYTAPTGAKYVELTGLTPGSYTVTEVETDGSDHNADVTLDTTPRTVVVAAGANDTLAPVVTITNNRGSGGLIVTKKLENPITTADSEVKFTFEVELTGATVADGKYGNMTFTSNKATFTLSAGESIMATGLPVGVTYTVTEKNQPDGFSQVKSEGATGTITNATSTATFTNKRDTGNLTVSKSTNPTGTTGPFNFTVTLGDNTISGKFGDMEFTNGVASFGLEDGDSKTATGLPAGVTYTVAENSYAGITIWEQGSTGSITKDATATVKATNYAPGSLLLSKLVTVGGGKPSGTQADGTYKFTITGSSTGTGTMPERETTSTYSTEATITIRGGALAGGTVGGRDATIVTYNGQRYIEVPNLRPGRYTITEQNADNGTTLTKIEGGEGGKINLNNRSVGVIVSPGRTGSDVPAAAAAQFTNNRKVGALEFRKLVTVNDTATTGIAADGTYSFKVEGPSGGQSPSRIITVTVEDGKAKSAVVDGKVRNLGTEGWVELEGLIPGTYTITELDSGTGTTLSIEVAGTGTEIITETINETSTTITYAKVTVAANDEATAHKVSFTNNIATGSLRLSKKVTISGAQPSYGETRADGTYRFTVTGPEGGASASHEVTIKVSNSKVVSGTVDGKSVTPVGGYIEVANLLPGTYTITEEAPTNGTMFYGVSGGATNATAVTNRTTTAEVVANKVGTEVAAKGTVTFTNNIDFGSLTVKKSVNSSYSRDKTAEFEFEVELVGATDITGKYGDMTFNGGVATFTLKDGDEATATGLPIGTNYIVREKQVDGITTTTTQTSGTIYRTADGSPTTVEFTNTRGMGELVLNKEVLVDGQATSGTLADGVYTFEIVGPGEGTFVSTTRAELEIKNGQAATVTKTDLPTGHYVVREVAGTNRHVTMDAREFEVEITTGSYDSAAPVVTFTNKVNTGSLTVSKTVTSEDKGSAASEFGFTVTLSDTSITDTFGDMAFVNGVASFTLRDGESITAKGLPENVRYTVEETSLPSGYVEGSHQNATGTIVAGKETLASMQNAYVPDVPTTPRTPEAPAPRGAIPRTGDTMPVGVPPFLLAAGLALASVGYLLKRRKEIRPHGAHMRR